MDGSSDLEVIDLRSSVSILIAKYLQKVLSQIVGHRSKICIFAK